MLGHQLAVTQRRAQTAGGSAEFRRLPLPLGRAPPENDNVLLQAPPRRLGRSTRMAADAGTGLLAAYGTPLSSNRCRIVPCSSVLTFAQLSRVFVFVLGCPCGRELKSPDRIETPRLVSHCGSRPEFNHSKTHGEPAPKSQTHLHVRDDIVKMSCCRCSNCFYEPGKIQTFFLKRLINVVIKVAINVESHFSNQSFHR